MGERRSGFYFELLSDRWTCLGFRGAFWVHSPGGPWPTNRLKSPDALAEES